jgi:tRNA(Ile2)-agmatinylcytidine synthase
LIAYRKQENCGTPRIVDGQKVAEFAKKTFPYTYNNYDQGHGRVLIAPHGPDPVFFGVRGESAEVVASALPALMPEEEKLEGWTIFRSNQGTNMHLRSIIDLHNVKAYTAGHLRCRVKSKPRAMEGGHVFFAVEQTGAEMPAAVYEPTGLANVAVGLEPGDLIEIGAGVRKGTVKHPKILNIEYISVLELAPAYDVANPLCKKCGKRMKSEGRNKGYQCDRCKFRDPAAQKVMTEKARSLKTGLYVPVPKAHRHLTKPLQRYGMEKKGFEARGLSLLQS